MKKKIGLVILAAMLATGTTVFAGTVKHVKGKAACTCSKDAKCGNACQGPKGCTCHK